MTDFRERLNDDSGLFGVICSMPDPFSAEMLGWTGVDWVCVDLQHGMVGQEALVGILQAFALTKTPTLVRVPWNDPAQIMHALDTGASGVIVPMVNSAADAVQAVAACRYPPLGIRSWGPTRAILGRPKYDVDSANREVICTVMIETREAMAALDEILAVPGVDAAFVGPSDLAIAHGLPPSLQADSPEVGELLARIVSRCRHYQVVPAIFTSGRDPALRWRHAGFRLFTVGSDRLLMSEATKALVSSIRAAL